MKQEMIQMENKTTTGIPLWLSVYTVEPSHSMKHETIQRWDNSRPEVECEIARGELQVRQNKSKNYSNNYGNNFSV